MATSPPFFTNKNGGIINAGNMGCDVHFFNATSRCNVTGMMDSN
jgi:hypothetical protein